MSEQPIGPEDPPVYPDKAGKDLPEEERAIPQPAQVPELDGDPEDIDNADSPDEGEL